MRCKLGVRAIVAAGVCAVAALTVTTTPASASTEAARPVALGSAHPLVTRTAGPYSSAGACAAVEGAYEVAGVPIVRNCYEVVVANPNGPGGVIEWFFAYSAFF